MVFRSLHYLTPRFLNVVHAHALSACSDTFSSLCPKGDASRSLRDGRLERVKLGSADRWDFHCYCGKNGTTLAPTIHESTGITEHCESCSACHADQVAAWRRSHHGWALRAAQGANVLGDFHDANFEFGGVRTRFFRWNGQAFVETDGPDGAPTAYEIRYTVGVEPLQQYLVELDKGRLQVLDIAWDVARKRWYHLYPDQEPRPGIGLHWTGPYKNWQARCAGCHQTNFIKGYDPKARTYNSTWSEPMS